jgi:hypothetical protein
MNAKKISQYIGIFLVLIVGLVSVGFFVRDLIRGEDSQKKAMQQILKQAQEMEIEVSQSAAIPNPPEILFKNYRIEKTRSGHLESLVKLEKTSQPSSGFNSLDAKIVEKQARVVLEQVSKSLGVEARDLKTAGINAGAFSAQAYFQQTIEGLEVAPYGSVSLDFSKEGELARLENDLIRPHEIVNLPKLTSQEVQTNLKLSSKPRHILWASRPASDKGATALVHAYEFHEQGHQIVVNAESGEVLYKRDRRIR